MHSHFEELCALAVTGQISGDAMHILDQHSRECDSCREFLQDLSPLKTLVAPILAATHAKNCEPPEGIRERFLQRAAAAGLNLRPEPALVMAEAPQAIGISESGLTYSLITAGDRVRAWYQSAFRLAVPVAAAILCGLLGYLIAERRLNRPTQTVVGSAPTVQVPVTPTAAASAAESALKSQRAEAQQRIDQLSHQLLQAQAEKKELLARLEETAQHVAAGTRFEQQFKAEAQKLQDAEARLAILQSDLDAERSKQGVDDAILIAQQRATQEANDKLARLQAQVDREREMNGARSGASDMIAARNLHIVDIYDTETRGGRKRPFGRVFYVEGQSLVFYAYDLGGITPSNSKISFRVWGETAGVKSAKTYNLGVLRIDEPGQSRWKLSFDDPKVLAHINAVYITAEPGTSPKSEPSGRKLMYAFLGSPNHP